MCKCIEALGKELEQHGCELDTVLRVGLKTGVITESMAIRIKWLGTKKRRKSPTTVVCAYCPCCGKKVKDPDDIRVKRKKSIRKGTKKCTTTKKAA